MKFSALIKQRLAASAQQLVVVILFFSFFSFFLTTSIYAQVGNYQPNPYAAPNTNTNVPTNLHTWTQNVMIEVLSALSCQLAGVDPTNSQGKCLGTDKQTGKIGYIENNGGAIGVMGNMIAVLYNPPLHTSDYINYLAQNFGITKTAYAQQTGTGFDGLNPLLNLWKTFRNLSYLIFVLVFIIIGFAIVLRINIDARTVMSIGNQLPKIIVALLLITFSYAIAGFLIDMMYVATYTAVNIISSADKTNQPAIVKTVNKEFNTPPIGFSNELLAKKPGDTSIAGLDGGFMSIANNASGGIREMITKIFSSDTLNKSLSLPPVPTTCKPWELLCRFGEWTGKAIGETMQNIFASILGMIIGGLAFIVVLIAMLWAMMRLWFALLKAYIFILIDVVIAPFWIMAGVLPGSPAGFGTWIKDLLAQLSAFPVTIIMFVMGKVFIDEFSAGSSSSFFIPPLIGTPGAEALGPLIGLGIILITPSVVEMTKEAFKAPSFKYMQTAGQAIGAGAGGLTKGSQTAMYGVTGGSKPGEKGWGAVAKRAIGI